MSKALIDLYISNDEVISRKNVLQENNEIKEKVQKS